MRFEKLNDKKIRIFLSLEDMKLNNVSMKSIFSNSDSAQKLLQFMLDKAVKEIGFETGDSKLLVEALMCSSEECIFTITKLSNKDTNTYNKYYPFIFKFDEFEDFIDLCTYVKNMSNLDLKKFSTNFSLILHHDAYYLLCLDFDAFSVLLDYMTTIFSEFGENVSNISLHGILYEYGKIIFDKNAILQCINYF